MRGRLALLSATASSSRPSGKIAKVWTKVVNPNTHSDDVLAAEIAAARKP